MLHKTKKHFFHTIQHQVYNERPALRTDQHYRAPTSIQSDDTLKNVALYHYTQLFINLSTLCTFADYSLNINSFKSVDKYKIHLHHYLHYLHERVQSGTTLSSRPLHIQMQIGSLTHLLYTRQTVCSFHTHAQICYATGILRYRESGFSVGATKFSLPLYRKTRVAVQTKASGSAGKFHRYIHSLRA